jgi:hypothetical protein
MDTTGTFVINHLPEVEKNVSLVKGWFDSSIPAFLEEHSDKIIFLHIEAVAKLQFSTANIPGKCFGSL